jgi:NTE family protein
MTDKTSVSLVLGSGGARGLAHIGVIHWLEENDYDIASISGCSMGALIGGIYAAGKMDDYEHWIRAIDKMDVLSYLDLSWQQSGLVKGDKIIDALKELVGDRDIEDLPIPFTAVASNLKTGKELWIQSGQLFGAIRASISLPFLLTPYEHKGASLVDGGVLNPVPIAPTFGDGTDITIAVSLGGEHEDLDDEEKAGEDDDTESDLEASLKEYSSKIKQFINGLDIIKAGTSKQDISAFEVGLRSFDLMQSTIARQKLAAYPPDVLIELPSNVCQTLDYHRAAYLIDFGYKRAAEKLEHMSRS